MQAIIINLSWWVELVQACSPDLWEIDTGYSGLVLRLCLQSGNETTYTTMSLQQPILSSCFSAGRSPILPWQLPLMMMLLAAATASDSLRRGHRDDNMDAINTTLGANSTNGTNSDNDPILSAEAIANITATGVAICIISSVLCYLYLCFNKYERMDRVRMALERNRQIERQLAAARERERKEKEQQEGGGGGGGREELFFSQVHTSHEGLHLPVATVATEEEGEERLLAGSGATPTLPDPETQPTVSTSTGDGSAEESQTTTGAIEVEVTVVQPARRGSYESTQ